jgi:hypothetical protein
MSSGTSASAVSISVCLTTLTPRTFNSREKCFLHLVHNTVGVCNPITLLSLYYISSRLVNLLQITDDTVKVSDILDITVSFKFINAQINLVSLIKEHFP